MAFIVTSEEVITRTHEVTLEELAECAGRTVEEVAAEINDGDYSAAEHWLLEEDRAGDLVESDTQVTDVTEES